jgi:putative transposase
MASTAGCCRFVYNHFLAVQKELYEKRKETNDPSIKFLTYPQACNLLTQLKQEEATSWLKEPPSQSLQQSLKHLNEAVARWLRNQSGFPNFKKKGVHDAFKLPDPPVVDPVARTVKLPKLGEVKYRKSREVLGTIKSATVSRDGKHWYISITAEQAKNKKLHPAIKVDEVGDSYKLTGKAVGIDLGVTHFATLSTGEHIDMPESLNRLMARVVTLQKQFSHKTKGSNNRKKAAQRLSKAYKKVRDARLDFLHKTSTYIAKNHSHVAIEDLKVKNMTRSARGTKDNPGKNVRAKSGLNRSIAKQSWGTFRRLLEYKLQDLNGILVPVDHKYTSQMCSKCGAVHKDNRKSQAKFKCIACGYETNADYNAAVNISASVKAMADRVSQGDYVLTPA